MKKLYSFVFLLKFNGLVSYLCFFLILWTTHKKVFQSSFVTVQGFNLFFISINVSLKIGLLFSDIFHLINCLAHRIQIFEFKFENIVQNFQWSIKISYLACSIFKFWFKLLAICNTRNNLLFFLCLFVLLFLLRYRTVNLLAIKPFY